MSLDTIYIIANANKYNTVLEVLEGIDKYYPEFKDKFTSEEIRKELRAMSDLVMCGEKLYPNIKIYGLHTYYILSNGYCIHDDDINEWVNEYDDTSICATYTVDGDLVPVHFNEVDDDTGDMLLEYYNGNIEKPIWVI